MKGGLGDIMKKAQQMQEQMQKAQEEIASMEVEGQSGAGLVRVTMNGRHELIRVAIDDSLIGDDKDMLEDLIAAAVNDATQKIESTTRDKLGSVAGGMNLPGGMKFPF